MVSGKNLDHAIIVVSEILDPKVIAVLEILDRAKCTKQPALNVVMNAKFHSNLQKENPFIAENVIEIRKDFNYL